MNPKQSDMHRMVGIEKHFCVWRTDKETFIMLQGTTAMM